MKYLTLSGEYADFVPGSKHKEFTPDFPPVGCVFEWNKDIFVRTALGVRGQEQYRGRHNAIEIGRGLGGAEWFSGIGAYPYIPCASFFP